MTERAEVGARTPGRDLTVVALEDAVTSLCYLCFEGGNPIQRIDDVDWHFNSGEKREPCAAQLQRDALSALADLHATVAALRGALESVEWLGRIGPPRPREIDCCILCGVSRMRGHKDGCEIGNALRRGES